MSTLTVINAAGTALVTETIVDVSSTSVTFTDASNGATYTVALTDDVVVDDALVEDTADAEVVAEEEEVDVSAVPA